MAAHGVSGVRPAVFGRAGFLNGLEWYVVRGISDYGDSRTTALWRSYAAFAAAAFARALLGECDPLGRPDGR
jgi:nucleoside phosphorylase